MRRLALLALALSANSAIAARPNILLIMADDLGFSDLGCYGGEIATPNLDTLAAGGLRFTQFYNTARCWPTRAALQTGFYAQHVRRDAAAGVKRGNRPKWSPLLASHLSKAGYRSYHSGKWHLDGKPLQNGFQRSYELRDQHRFFNPTKHFLDDKPLPPVKRKDGFYSTIAVADHALACLKDHAANFADQPFFHYLAFAAPHFPLHALPEDIARYRETYRNGWDAHRTARSKRLKALGIVDAALSRAEPKIGPPYAFPDAIAQLGLGEVIRPLPWSDLTPVQQEFQATKMAIHAAMIDRMDREIGRVLDQIRAMNAFEDTLIIFLSDNGASAEIMVRGDGHDPKAAMGSAASHLCLGPGWSNAANTPFRRHKTWVHEGGCATPFIVHWPEGITARGELRKQPSHVVDLVPTVLDLLDLAATKTDGQSFVGQFSDSPMLSDREIWWMHDGHRAIRIGDWKLVASKGDSWELYNLAVDRSETHDLATAHPERVAEFAKRWQAKLDHFIADLDGD